MGTLHNLTIRTATAVGRLAELQRRADRIVEKSSPLARTALAELSTALEELQVANEALQMQVDELGAARAEAAGAQRALDEFADTVPVPVLWTDRAGVIEKSNDVASELLNISKNHLIGKPLMLFVTDRPILFGALRSLCEAATTPTIDVEVTIRPRERRPRKMKLMGRRLEHNARCVWFLHDVSAPALDAREPTVESDRIA